MTKKHSDKVFTKITLALSKPKTLWFSYKNCNNIFDIPEVLKNDVKDKKLIDLVKNMYLLATFKYSKY